MFGIENLKYFTKGWGGGRGDRVQQIMANFKWHQITCSPRDIKKIQKKNLKKKCFDPDPKRFSDF